jgi:hypothetical protein
MIASIFKMPILLCNIFRQSKAEGIVEYVMSADDDLNRIRAFGR